MQDLRGPRKIRPGLVLVWPHPSRSEAAYRSWAGHGRRAEIRPNLAGSGWLVEFSLDGEPLRAVGVSTDEAAHGPGVRGHGTGRQGHPLGWRSSSPYGARHVGTRFAGIPDHAPRSQGATQETVRRRIHPLHQGRGERKDRIGVSRVGSKGDRLVLDRLSLRLRPALVTALKQASSAPAPVASTDKLRRSKRPRTRQRHEPSRKQLELWCLPTALWDGRLDTDESTGRSNPLSAPGGPGRERRPVLRSRRPESR